MSNADTTPDKESHCRPGQATYSARAPSEGDRTKTPSRGCRNASEAPSPLHFRCCTGKAGRGGVGAQSAPTPPLHPSPVAAAPFSTPSIYGYSRGRRCLPVDRSALDCMEQQGKFSGPSFTSGPGSILERRTRGHLLRVSSWRWVSVLAYRSSATRPRMPSCRPIRLMPAYPSLMWGSCYPSTASSGWF